MCESIHQRHERWQLGALLAKYSDLQVIPSWDDDLVLSGTVSFRLLAPSGQIIEDSYSVTLHIPSDFPETNPSASERDGRIPHDYHKLVGNYLCLGAPTAIRMKLSLSPSLLTFLEELVIPYLAGYSYFAKQGTPLFGELAHGSDGIRDYLAELFLSKSTTTPEEFLRLASLRKRLANKEPCPCHSGRRLGRCHNRAVNALRTRLTRSWFRDEYLRVLKQLPMELASGGATRW